MGVYVLYIVMNITTRFGVMGSREFHNQSMKSGTGRRGISVYEEQGNISLEIT